VFLKRSAANGDVMVAASVAAAIKKRTPNCSITFATKCPDMLLKHPYIDYVETLSGEQGIITSVDGFDATYDMDNAYELFPKKHMLDAYANRAGVLREDCKICLTCEPIFDIKLPSDYIVIHPGRTSWVGRHWDAKRFNEIARRLRNLGNFVVLIGSQEGADALPAANLDLRGITTIPQLGTVIRGAKFFVGIDSLPMWIAQTFDIPGLCFFGCVDPKTRLIGKMQAVQQTGISCLGCHNSQPIPCVGTSTCPYGQPVCERLTVDQFWQALMENPHL
jgi:ADP-heptose:LPS heptosyltransferase